MRFKGDGMKKLAITLSDKDLCMLDEICKLERRNKSRQIAWFIKQERGRLQKEKQGEKSRAGENLAKMAAEAETAADYAYVAKAARWLSSVFGAGSNCGEKDILLSFWALFGDYYKDPADGAVNNGAGARIIPFPAKRLA